MAQNAALLIPPSREPTGEENDPLEATALLWMNCVEDLDLAERVERALRATGYAPLRNVTVSVRARGVTLDGRVPSYYLKQVAQATALAVSGAHHIRNQLDVGRPN
jgi:hypothetical protein